MKNRVVFFGTPAFAAEVLRDLVERHVPIVGVVTQPDKERGRSRQISPSPVKTAALECSLKGPLLQPDKASDEGFLHQLAALQGDLYVVVAFGQILPQKLLSIPPLGCINVHASLLPRYRGAAPIQRCLLEGERETGICIQKMVRQLDAGDVIATSEVEISSEMIFGELEARLCEISKKLLFQVLQMYEEGVPPAVPQNGDLATYAAKVGSEEGEIQWAEPAEKIHNKIRAFSPRPGAWSWVEKGKKRVKILRAKIVEGMGKGEGNPGEVASRNGIISCGSGALELLEVVPEGKKAMSGADWLRGTPSFHRFPEA